MNVNYKSTCAILILVAVAGCSGDDGAPAGPSEAANKNAGPSGAMGGEMKGCAGREECRR